MPLGDDTRRDYGTLTLPLVERRLLVRWIPAAWRHGEGRRLPWESEVGRRAESLRSKARSRRGGGRRQAEKHRPRTFHQAFGEGCLADGYRLLRCNAKY